MEGMKMSKSSELDVNVKRYILSNVDGSNYGVNPTTTEDKIKFLHDTFYSEYGWAVERMGEQKALAEWFQGLPSACNIHFYNKDILDLAKAWNSLPDNATERQEQKILDNWWNLLAAKTGQLFRRHNLKRVA
jgi:hypothetical protein